MYTLKQIPNDFIVEEYNDFDLVNNSKCLLYLMKKKNYNTVDAIRIISNILHVKSSQVGFAGNKDKKAITYQYITIQGSSKERIDSLELNDIELTFVGYLGDRMNLGDLEGNKFTITIRDVDPGYTLDQSKLDQVPNVFGEQRFSTNNSEVGRSIIKKDFKKAFELVVQGRGRTEKEMEEYVEEYRNDYVGALRLLPKKNLRLYVHAYQSELWNKAVLKYIEEFNPTENIAFPIIGFGTEFEDFDIEDIYNEIMMDEEISFRDFIIKSIPELTSEGVDRNIFLNMTDFKLDSEMDDDLNEGKKKIVVEFKLGKGSYATTLIKYLFE